MRKLLLFMAVFGVAVCTPNSAVAQITIDNFSQPVQPGSGTNYVIVTNTGIASSSFVQGSVDAIGATRVYYAQKTAVSPVAESVLVGMSGSQAYRQNTTPGTTGRSKLLYGYSAVNTASLDADNYTGGHTLANLNQNFSGMSSVALEYSLGGNGSTGTMQVTLISGSEGTAQVATVTLPIVSAVNQTLPFTAASFLASNPSINFADVDQIVVSLNGIPAGVNAALDSIRVNIASIPEPTSIGMIGLTVSAAAGGLYYRKRRSATRRRRRQR
jgi:hypothetical protein